MNRYTQGGGPSGFYTLYAPNMRTQCIFAYDDDLSFDNDIVRICNFPSLMLRAQVFPFWQCNGVKLLGFLRFTIVLPFWDVQLTRIKGRNIMLQNSFDLSL